jgi:hypothetical protein
MLIMLVFAYYGSGKASRWDGEFKMLADVSDMIEQAVIAEGEAPFAVDPFETIMISASGDDLQRQRVCLLQNSVG